jgi:hypothetical protein
MNWQRLRRLRIDDVFNGIAVVFLLAFMATWQAYAPLEYPAQLYAAGLTDALPPEYDIIEAMKIDFANLVLYWCTIYSVKASFLALYWQIFEISRRFRLAWFALTIYMVVSFLVTVFCLFWHCGSPATLIDPGTHFHCHISLSSVANADNSCVQTVEVQSCRYHSLYWGCLTYCWRLVM